MAREYSIKPYRISMTKTEVSRLEKRMLEISEVYRWIREAGYSKSEIIRRLHLRWANIFQCFEKTGRYITVERLFTLSEMLPEKSMREILMALSPEFKKKWYELCDDELDELMRKLGDK